MFLAWARHFTLTVALSNQALVLQEVDNAIHCINHCPTDKQEQNQLNYPVDGTLGPVVQRPDNFNQWISHNPENEI